MSAPPMSVELRRVTKRFGAVMAVEEVSLAVRAGEFLTLLGPSGCGKTTLLRLIAGFETPDAGAVWLGGADVTALPPHRRDVNQVFQSYALFPHLSVRDNIAFGLRMQRRRASDVKQRVAEMIALVALEGCEERKPHQLSGGQRQRVALARALAPQPAVLLLDEPLSALDERLRQAMQLELKRLQRQVGTTFVFVTHDQDEALTMSDRIALVNRGRIEQIGTAEEIYHRPATAFAAEFIGQANVCEAELIRRDGAWARLRVAEGFELTVGSDAWPEGMARGKIAVRPEKIQLSKEPLSAVGTVAVTVREVVFKGAHERITTATAAGLRLTAVVAGQSRLRAEDRVWVGVKPEDIIVLRADRNERGQGEGAGAG